MLDPYISAKKKGNRPRKIKLNINITSEECSLLHNKIII
jgi:hypothetical protein